MRLSFALWVEENSRDAAPVDIEYDFSYDSSACREDSDYWHHHSAAGTVAQFHVTELRARIDPTSVKGCLVHPSLLSDARITSAMTDGTEFTLQDNWRAKDSRTLPCRWTGTTVFNTAKTKVKVSYDECAAPAELKTAGSRNGFCGHALQSIDCIIIPARSCAKVPTGARFTRVQSH